MLLGIFKLLIGFTAFALHLTFWFVLGNNLTIVSEKRSAKDLWSNEVAFIVCFIGWLITLPIVMRLLEMVLTI